MKDSNRLSNSLILLITAALITTSTLAAKPLPGKYSGKTGARGNDGRISFKVSRNGKKISNLFVSAFVFCLRQNKFVPAASRTDRKKFRLKPSGRFIAKGLDKNGVSYKVQGKTKGSRRFKGEVEISVFSTFFNPFTGFIDGEACGGTRDWTAKK